MRPAARPRYLVVQRLDHFQNPCLEVFVERTEFLEPVIAVEGYRGPALSEDECLRVFGDEFQ